MVRVLIVESVDHLSKAPSSEFKSDKRSGFKNQGRPVNPRLHPRSSTVYEFCFQSHQSKVPSSEFKGYTSSDVKTRGIPSVQGSIFGVEVW